jgi:probable rRNA maturation factor
LFVRRPLKGRPHRIMILIEPTIQAKFGRSVRQRALAAFLRRASEAAGLTGEITVLLTSDKEVRRLNRTFRRKDQPTDVLSFPASSSPNGHGQMAGDLAVSVETAARQATEAGHPLAQELQVLILHGVLHLGGYDHESDQGEMARKEATLRRRFGLNAGLIERAKTPTGKKHASVRRRSAR